MAEMPTGSYAVKRFVRARDDNACTECGMTDEACADTYGRGLHVHRVIPGSIYTVEGCVLLCRGCHHLAHGWPKPSLISIAKVDKIMLDELVRHRREKRSFPESHSEVLGTMIRQAYEKLMKETNRWR